MSMAMVSILRLTRFTPYPKEANMACCSKLRQLADDIRAGCYMDSRYDPFDDLKKMLSNNELIEEGKKCTGDCAKSDTFPSKA